MKKLAKDLRPGDILPADQFTPRRVVVHVCPSSAMEGCVAVRCVALQPIGVNVMLRDTHMTLDNLVDVAAPELTPAQQHADELVEMLWRAANHMRGYLNMEKMENEARALLRKINPPNPPTAEELAKALDATMMGQNVPEDTVALLNRARQAGML